MAGFISELCVDSPDVMADSNLANLDPTHLDEMVTPALVRDVRSINIALEAKIAEMEDKIKITLLMDQGLNRG